MFAARCLGKARDAALGAWQDRGDCGIRRRTGSGPNAAGACDRGSENSPQDFFDEPTADVAAFSRSVPGRCMEIPLEDVDWTRPQAVRSTGVGRLDGGTHVASYPWPTAYWGIGNNHFGHPVRRLHDQERFADPARWRGGWRHSDGRAARETGKALKACDLTVVATPDRPKRFLPACLGGNDQARH